MNEPAAPDPMQKAKRFALFGVGCVTLGIVLVFVVPQGAFGVPEGLTVIGMLAILSAVWMAAEAQT